MPYRAPLSAPSTPKAWFGQHAGLVTGLLAGKHTATLLGVFVVLVMALGACSAPPTRAVHRGAFTTAGGAGVSHQSTPGTPDENAPVPHTAVWEPECGHIWDPPDLPLIEGRNGEIQVKDSSNRVWMTFTGDLHNLGPHWQGAYYTWPVIVQDGVVVSPMLLGSDAIFEIALEPLSSVTVSGEHSLADFCATTSYGDPLGPGHYSVHLLVLDFAAYHAAGERAVLAVFDAVEFTIAADGTPVIQ